MYLQSGHQCPLLHVPKALERQGRVEKVVIAVHLGDNKLVSPRRTTLWLGQAAGQLAAQSAVITD